MQNPIERDEVTLRSAAPSDVDALFEVRCSVAENHQSREELAELGITPASVARMIQGGDYITLIAELGGEPVGFTMVEVSENYLFACFVRPAFENRGIGRALMEQTEEELMRRGVTSIWLSTGAEPDLRAVGFYENLGWSRDGFLDDGQIRFIKQLLPQ